MEEEKEKEQDRETVIYTAIGRGNNEEMRDRQSNGGRG